jgi:hypothetical protein
MQRVRECFGATEKYTNVSTENKKTKMNEKRSWQVTPTT